MTEPMPTSHWDSVPFQLCVDRHTIAIWSINLDVDETCIEVFTELMTPREHARAARLKVPRRRRRWIASRIALRLFTARSLNISIHELHYRYGSLGKPGLDPNHHVQPICFNNTDSGDLGLIALTVDREVGVDLERLPRRTRSERITRRRFAAQEFEPILGTEEPERNRRFLQCWTRKEAWGKAIGVGIRYPMRDIVLCDNLPHDERRIEYEDETWTLKQLQPDTHSIGCVVAAGEDFQLKCFQFNNDFEKLLRETT